MNISIELPDEIELALRQRAQDAGQDPASFVRELVIERLSNEHDATMSMPPRLAVPPEEFARRLDAWIALHPVLDHVIDDSRELI